MVTPKLLIQRLVSPHCVLTRRLASLLSSWRHPFSMPSKTPSGPPGSSQALLDHLGWTARPLLRGYATPAAIASPNWYSLWYFLVLFSLRIFLFWVFLWFLVAVSSCGTRNLQPLVCPGVEKIIHLKKQKCSFIQTEALISSNIFSSRSDPTRHKCLFLSPLVTDDNLLFGSRSADVKSSFLIGSVKNQCPVCYNQIILLLQFPVS